MQMAHYKLTIIIIKYDCNKTFSLRLNITIILPIKVDFRAINKKKKIHYQLTGPRTSQPNAMMSWCYSQDTQPLVCWQLNEWRTRHVTRTSGER